MSDCCTTRSGRPARHTAALAGLYQALADPTRLRILAILADTPGGPGAPPDRAGAGALPDRWGARGGELCVCHIHASLGVSQPTASRHLAYLRKAGLVVARRGGVWMHYRLVRPQDPVLAGVFDAAVHALGHVVSTSRDRRRAAQAALTVPPPA